MVATLEKDPNIRELLTKGIPPVPPDIPHDGEHLSDRDPIPVRVSLNIKKETWDGIRDMALELAEESIKAGREPMNPTYIVNRLLVDFMEIRKELAEARQNDPEAKLLVESNQSRTAFENSIFEITQLGRFGKQE